VTAHPSGVLDTNVLVLLERLQPDDLPAEPVITAISLAELSVGPLVTDDPAERAARQIRLQEVEAAFDPLPFDAASARTFGRVAAELRRSGRRVQARAFDAMIAAVAVANDLPVYTSNPRDFAGIEALTVVPVPHPGAV
jgi:tRNA(fMet)-specific endonuclease VapC